MSTTIAAWQCHGAADAERRRAARYPLARWYLRPAAGWLAATLANTPVRPVHLTLCGLTAAAAAAAVLWRLEAAAPAAALVLLYWFFDRADGQLARRQRTVSAWGAWLDANVDEAADVALHVAVAGVLAAQTAAVWPWWLLAAFLAGKYLFMYGLNAEEWGCSFKGVAVHGDCPDFRGDVRENGTVPLAGSWLRTAYHFPGNADVRVHLLAVALIAGGLAAELAFVAGYYNMRWIVRYVLVARRLGGTP